MRKVKIIMFYKKIKNMRILSMLITACFLLFNNTYGQQKKYVYKESLEDFPNPERGFYLPSSAKPGELFANELTALRTVESQKVKSANYSAKVSLIYRGYNLSDFRNSPLSNDFLQNLKKDFDVIRKSGQKVIIRFAYTYRANNKDCPGSTACPPYGDAPKEIVLEHIAQLKPLFMENGDVIAVIQQGFIGIWGENYYTDYFGTGIVSDSNWADRNEVLKALLDATPKNRMVQVRTPKMKQRFVYGPQLTGINPLKEKEAFNQMDKSRIAFHNDCFLSSENDYGTFQNASERKYFADDSRYVAVGGETCNDAFSPQNDCAPLGRAEEEMAAMHYSFLNISYNNLVNNDWEEQGCMASIKRRLGYRIVLREAELPEEAKLGKSITINLQLENVGYASPFNPRPLQLILRNTTSKKVEIMPLMTSIQKWFPGQIKVQKTVSLPADIQPGSYEVLLNLPDGSASLEKRPEYSIQLANENIWEKQTGYNKLGHTVNILQ